VSSLSALIDFLVGLMRDQDAHAAFAKDPQNALAQNGLSHVTGQDVRDARMIMQDGGGLRPTGHSGHQVSHDPVREIHHTTTHYQVDQHYQYVDQTFNLITIDDRDTTVVDSFNSNDNNDTHVVAVQDNSHDTTVNVEDSFNHPADPAPEPKPAPEPEPHPVEHEPEPEPVEHEPVHVEPVAEEPVAPIEDHHLTEPADHAPDLDHHLVDAAII
jgi:hypothetical protein